MSEAAGCQRKEFLLGFQNKTAHFTGVRSKTSRTQTVEGLLYARLRSSRGGNQHGGRKTGLDINLRHSDKLHSALGIAKERM